MLDRILAARRLWIAAAVLSPAALVAGFFLLLKTEPRPVVPMIVNAPRLESMARDFSRRQGIDTSSWTAGHAYSIDNGLLSFVNANPESKRLWGVAPPLYFSASLSAPGTNRKLNVYISVDGKIIGYDWKNPPPGAGATLTDAEALRLASTQLPMGFQFGEPSVATKGADRLYTFQSSAIPHIDLKAEVNVAANRVASFRTSAERQSSASTGMAEKVQLALTSAGVVFMCLIALFSLYRYASRSIQQEVSHPRSLTLAGLCGCLCILFAFNALSRADTGQVPFAFILLIFAVMGMVGGSLLAAAYGGGEGDVREAYPAKLTSLDALLTGRAFSHNVGISVLFGLVCAAWLICIQAVVTAPFRDGGAQGSGVMLSPVMRLVWLMPFITYPLLSLTFAAAGLLQPLAFLQRYAPQTRRWRVPALLLCAGLVSFVRPHTGTATGFVVESAILILALLVPFFVRDLLASLVSVTALLVVINRVTIMSLLGRTTNLESFGVVAVAAVIFAVISVMRGKTFTDEQVRPLYARHIAERKSLEAEVSAAREAQLRLLPQRTPDFAGLSISAACVPAETVGGDFYDFFRLGDGRLGVFMAEGNNRGLAAALTIALAKGYLMHCVGKCREPVDVLTRLETALASIFESPGSELTDFAFAVIDTVNGEVRYARTGAYPKVVVASANGSTERLAPVRGRSAPITEGVAQLSAGDHVVLFTDGIGRRLSGAGLHKPEDAAGAILSRGARDVEQMRQQFLHAAKSSVEHDDLTVVVVQMQAQVDLVLEVVA